MKLLIILTKSTKLNSLEWNSYNFKDTSPQLLENDGLQLLFIHGYSLTYKEGIKISGGNEKDIKDNLLKILKDLKLRYESEQIKILFHFDGWSLFNNNFFTELKKDFESVFGYSCGKNNESDKGTDEYNELLHLLDLFRKKIKIDWTKDELKYLNNLLNLNS